MAETEASVQREARLSAEAERLRVEAQEANDEAELRRTLSDIAKASSPREAARLAAQLRIPSDGTELHNGSAAPDAPVEDVVPEGVPHKGHSYLVVTHTRFSRRVQVGSFSDQQEAETAFDGGSKVDSRLLLKVGAEGQLQELQAWAVMREAVRRECLHEARRWLRHEEFRLMERSEDGGKQGVVEKQTGKSFLHEGRWERLFLSMRDRVLIAHDSADAVGTAPLMALPAHDCKLGLPKSQRKDRPYCFRVDLDPESLQRAASDERKLIFDPGSEEEMHAWIMTFGRAGAQVPSSYRQKIYIEDATLNLPPGGMMDWVSLMTDLSKPTTPWHKLWCEWRFPVISLHKTPGGEPVAVIDTEDYELMVGPADDVHTASVSGLSRTNSGSSLSRTGCAQLHSTDDLGRAFSWVLKRAGGTELGQVAVEPEPELEPELEPGLEPEDTDGFEMVDLSVGSSNFYGSRSDDLSWIGMAAGSGKEMRAWVTALQVPHAANSLPAARASKYLGARSYNALLVQYGSSRRLDLASEEFQIMTRDQVQELIDLCPQVCPDLTTLFVPESISRTHWDMFREGLPTLQRIVRGITIDAHDGIIAQAQRGSRLDLTGAEFAKIALVGLMNLRGDCAHIESIFFVKDREHTNSTFPRGPFCICNPETGKMLKIKSGGVEAVHDEGQVWEYNPRTKQLEDKDTQLVLTISDRQLSMRMSTGDKAQEWMYQAENKTIVNPSSGSVLDIAGGVDGTRVIGFASHGGANQTWTLLHDDDTGGRHNTQDSLQVALSEDDTDRLKQAWPKLQVAFLGREISATTFDAMMVLYQESGRIDLTGDEFANLSGLGMLELCELCPKPSKILLHSKHSISSLHIKEVKRQLKLGDDVIVVRDIKLSDCVRLQVKQAAEVDHRTVQTMVTPRSLPDELEMQEDILQRQSSRHACFRCAGTGLVRESRSAVTISFTTLEQSSEEVTCTWLFRDAHGSWNLYDKSTTAMLEREWRDAAAITDGQFPVVQLYQADRVVYEVDMNAMIQTNVITGVVRTVKRADEAFGEAGHPCWVCRGTGSTTKWLKEFDSQSVEVEHDCMICYDEASYGLSTECGHFYCESCIRRSLDAMMDTAQFPAFCPQCRVDANDAGEELTVGRILPDALSFLEQRKVITKDFLFRFQKQNGGGADEEKYFACPAKCGRFLIEEAVEFRTDKAHGIPVMRLGACPCGACICLQCKLEEHTSATTHQCPSVKGGAEIDAASLALVTKAGKKCPKCKSFVQRTEGCHVMMCGTNAHGKVSDALRNGGCAHIFDWNTLLALNDGYGFTDMNGSKARGNPLTARQLPKDEQKKCERPGCPFMFHADVKNNGGTHCCAGCKAGGGHGPSCHRLVFEAPAKEPVAVETGGSAGGDVGFTTAHETIELTQGGTLATKASGSQKQYQAAFCTDKIMGELKQPGPKSSERFRGKHSATFTVMSGTAIVGVANPEVLQASEWRPGGAEGGATCGGQGWGYVSICGDQKHNEQLRSSNGRQAGRCDHYEKTHSYINRKEAASTALTPWPIYADSESVSNLGDAYGHGERQVSPLATETQEGIKHVPMPRSAALAVRDILNPQPHGPTATNSCSQSSRSGLSNSTEDLLQSEPPTEELEHGSSGTSSHLEGGTEIRALGETQNLPSFSVEGLLSEHESTLRTNTNCALTKASAGAAKQEWHGRVMPPVINVDEKVTVVTTPRHRLLALPTPMRPRAHLLSDGPLLDRTRIMTIESYTSRSDDVRAGSCSKQQLWRRSDPQPRQLSRQEIGNRPGSAGGAEPGGAEPEGNRDSCSGPMRPWSARDTSSGAGVLDTERPSSFLGDELHLPLQCRAAIPAVDRAGGAATKAAGEVLRQISNQPRESNLTTQLDTDGAPTKRMAAAAPSANGSRYRPCISKQLLQAPYAADRAVEVSLVEADEWPTLPVKQSTELQRGSTHSQHIGSGRPTMCTMNSTRTQRKEQLLFSEQRLNSTTTVSSSSDFSKDFLSEPMGEPPLMLQGVRQGTYVNMRNLGVTAC
eukprot:COSAG02_NODE_1808_length_10843_cov_4.345867_2_plen_2020_part_00